MALNAISFSIATCFAIKLSFAVNSFMGLAKLT